MSNRRERRQTGMTSERLNALESLRELKKSGKTILKQYLEVNKYIIK
jgi:hypothetical protein